MKNSENARIYGSDIDAIWLAPVGTVMPVGLDASPGAAFEDVGWLGADGITETFTGSASEIRGHQGNGVVRKRVDTPGTQFKFIGLETKSQTESLRYVEKTVEITSGVRKTRRGAGQSIKARAAVIDLFDADNTATVKQRILIPRLEISADGDRVFVNSDIAGYPFLGEIIGDYDVLSTVAAGDVEDDTP